MTASNKKSINLRSTTRSIYFNYIPPHILTVFLVCKFISFTLLFLIFLFKCIARNEIKSKRPESSPQDEKMKK
uniref:Putative ovule protein n=1 Tax=Solanum chacoense TaxID=4108 RepID=A0A0V0I7G1_SOLCH